MTEKPPVLSDERILGLVWKDSWRWTEHEEDLFKKVAQAQRDADVAYYEKNQQPPIIGLDPCVSLEQARQETAREIFEEIEAELIAFEGFSQITQHQAAIINKIWWQSLKEKYEHLQD